jgi:malate permease and related proteins
MEGVLDVLLQVVVPAFLVIAAGFGLGRTFRLDLTTLNRLALYAAVPSLVFTSLAATDVAFEDAGRLLAGNALFLLTMAALASLVAWRFPRPVRRGLVATSLFGNAANIMLPVTLFAFGDEGLQRALILYVFTAVMLFTLGPLVVGGGAETSRRRFLVAILRLPVLWAALLGVAFNLSGVALPVGLGRGLELLGAAAIPVVLLSMGVQIERTGVRAPSLVNVVGTALKLVIGPLVGFATGSLVGARGLDLAVLTLLGAMPPAINVFLIALEFGADAAEVARTVILSTFTAVATLTIVLSVLAAYVV